MVEAVKEYILKALDFEGSMKRRSFWLAHLGVMIIILAAWFIFGLFSGLMAMASSTPLAWLFGFLLFLVLLALIAVDFGVVIPSLSSIIRRMRSAGFHWAYVFLLLVPFAGLAAIVVICAQPDQEQSVTVEEVRE